MPRLRIVLTLAIFISATAVTHAEDWPQFRGPGGQGQAVGTGWPLRWSEQENVAWHVPLPGRGWSSPVVLGEYIWLTTALETLATPDVSKRVLEQKGKDVPNAQVASHLTLKAFCVARTSGRLVRDLTLFEVDEPVVICAANSFASPTPVVDEGRLYCEFGALGTACLDADTGQVIWSRKLVVDHQVGPGSSPVVYGNLLVLVRDGIDQQYVTALDKATGATVWQTDRPSLSGTPPTLRKAFSTPLVFRGDGREQLVATGARWIVSYEPATGKELWCVDTGGTFSNASRPVYGCGLIFAGTSYGDSVLRAIRPDGRGDVTATHVVWQQQRSVPKLSSPLAAGDELFLVTDNGIASCQDARTGAVHWTERLSGNYSAAPVSADGRIYYFAEDGTTTIVRAGQQFERLAENRIEGRVLASPAFVEHTILLRTATHLYCIGP